jgi:hypothetical protein
MCLTSCSARRCTRRTSAPPGSSATSPMELAKRYTRDYSSTKILRRSDHSISKASHILFMFVWLYMDSNVIKSDTPGGGFGNITDCQQHCFQTPDTYLCNTTDYTVITFSLFLNLSRQQFCDLDPFHNLLSTCVNIERRSAKSASPEMPAALTRPPHVETASSLLASSSVSRAQPTRLAR